MRLSEQRIIEVPENADCVIAVHSRKIAQKRFQRFPVHNIIDQSLHRNTRSAKNGCAAQNIRINRDWQFYFHHLYIT